MAKLPDGFKLMLVRQGHKAIGQNFRQAVPLYAIFLGHTLKFEMNKKLKWILLSIAGGLLLFFCYVFYVFATFSFDDGKHYLKEDLIENYNTKTKQINELKYYINAIVPAKKSVDIEFDGNKRLDIFHVIDNGHL